MHIKYGQGVRKKRAKQVWCILVAVCLLALLLIVQTTILPTFSIFSAVPNLSLVLCICFSLMQGGQFALVFSAFGGLLQEALNGGTTGYNALLYLALSWICVCLHDRCNGHSMLFTPLLVFLLSFGYGCLCWGAGFLLWNDSGFGQLLLHQILPSALYSALTTPIFMFLVSRLCNRETCGRDWD